MHHRKKSTALISLALGIFALFLIFFVTRHSVDVGDKHLQTELKSYLQDHNINGVMLVTGKDGKPIVIKNNETSNKNQIVSADQLFPIASLQKLMTGTAVYQLQQQNQLSWNTLLSKYYPQVSGSNDITVRELMNHTSGLINNARPSTPLKTQEQQINYMLKYMKNDHLHTWDYQDVDYELLAAIISKQSNLTYNNYIQNSFAKPLHLTKIKDFSEVAQSEVPQPMSKNVSWNEVTVTTSSDFGAGNLFMSPKDYWKFVYNRVLKDPKMLDQFSNHAQHQEVAYFGGVYFKRYFFFKKNLIRAEGSIPGYNCCFVANYRTKQMIMLFSNNIDYLKLKRTSDYLMYHYMGVI